MTSAYSDVAMFTEIVGRGVYELPENLNWLINGKPVVDIGANIGASAAYFASKYPDSQVTAIEPNLRNYEILGWNAGQYRDQMEPWRYALSVEEGYVGSPNEEVGDKGRHSVYQYNIPGQEMGLDTAPAITPTGLVDKIAPTGRIGLLKVNIEGAENTVFSAPSSDILLQRSNVVIIEAHSHLVEGVSAVVDEAAHRNGLRQFDQRGSFKFFINPPRNPKHKITL